MAQGLSIYVRVRIFRLITKYFIMLNSTAIVSDLNKSTTDEILKAIKILDASNKEQKVLHLVLDSAEGESSLALEIVEIINSSTVDLIIDVGVLFHL